MRVLKLSITAVSLLWAVAGFAAQAMTIYKSPTCGCCEKYVEYLRKNGFEVTAVNSNDMDATKRMIGVPAYLASCHTVVIGSYIVEGHAPVTAITKLLKERPNVRGIAVPSMPPGSPGMESPRPLPYQVLTFDAKGQTAVYESHDAAQ